MLTARTKRRNASPQPVWGTIQSAVHIQLQLQVAGSTLTLLASERDSLRRLKHPKQMGAASLQPVPTRRNTYQPLITISARLRRINGNCPLSPEPSICTSRRFLPDLSIPLGISIVA